MTPQPSASLPTFLTGGLDAASSVPPFEQLKRLITDAASSGDAGVGTRLPPVRALADALSLAPNTVARAYRELEADGVVETRGRAGTFIASRDATERAAAAAATAFAERMADLGLGADAALALARTALAAHPPR
ncbi:GntR family transcriptional regulator [Leifsonia sp. NPDC058292]|uniref:GntR family transcriptional regulator n=1 Tax=Leifsonia sp. NPDC058292 TaxID=3346428 RepID=UPI0036D91E62